MSEARHQRFEIDIDEIERELRRSAESAPAPRPDPLAELARIVGQDDPFRGIIGESRSGAPRVASDPAAAAGGGYGNLDFAPDDRLGSRDTSPQAGGYDPVADVYGSPDAALAEDDMQPLRPRRSRGKLAAVAATLLVTTGAIAGGLYWQRAGGGFSPSGAPPLITADRTPVKKPPENPGGMEVPNQDRQIYDQKPDDGRSRVVDGREQPIDVQEAVRSMPSTADRAPAVSARAPVTGPAMPVDTGERLAGTGQAAPAAPSNGSNAVTTALGEPRRVRTVAVRPDGSVYTPTTTSSIAAAQPSLLPGNSLPPPVPVATISVPARSAPGAGPVSPAAQPAAAPAPVQAPVVAAAPAEPPATSEATPAPVKVLPPVRPRSLSESPAAEAPARTAALDTDAPASRADRKPAAEAGGNFAVQIAVRPTEEEARSAYSQLQDKFAADLDGKPARVTQGEVRGKTVHRVRVGPMSKADATALCNKLKGSGGSCFVANLN